MGAVYEGENIRIHRRVAIKVLHADVAKMAETMARFEREAQAAGRIGSEHIVEVLDLGSLQSGDRYMVMELMDGDSLSQRIRSRGKLSANELYPIARQLLDALSAAHNAGIVHRDLKPDNVFLLRSRRGSADFVKLLDFGISKFSGSNAQLSMTRTGSVMGTPYYMAPEQAKGARDLDHRVDLYAVGIVLYEALTGQVPFHAETFNQLLFKIVLEDPKPIEELVPDLDPELVAIVKKGMAREPALRFQTAAEFQAALDQWHQHASGQATAEGVERPLGTGPELAARPGALGMTPGNWTGESATAAEPVKKPKKAGGIVIGALVGAAALAAAGFFVLGGKKSPEQGATAATALEAPSTPPVASVPATTAAAPLIAPEPSASAVSAPSASAEAPHVEAAAPTPRAAVAPVKPLRAAPAPAPRAPAKSKEPVAAPAQTGRRIRTSL
jgi:serine/threonine-protein kinase